MRSHSLFKNDTYIRYHNSYNYQQVIKDICMTQHIPNNLMFVSSIYYKYRNNIINSCSHTYVASVNIIYVHPYVLLFHM